VEHPEVIQLTTLNDFELSSVFQTQILRGLRTGDPDTIPKFH
jgi:hypothetical protein